MELTFFMPYIYVSYIIPPSTQKILHRRGEGGEGGEGGVEGQGLKGGGIIFVIGRCNNTWPYSMRIMCCASI